MNNKDRKPGFFERIERFFQKVIPSTNIMYPVTNIKLPDAFNELEIPKALQLNPKKINDFKGEWINEWLNAS